MRQIYNIKEFAALKIGSLCYIECGNQLFNKKYFIIIKQPEYTGIIIVNDYYFLKDNEIRIMQIGIGSYSNYGLKTWVIE